MRILPIPISLCLLPVVAIIQCWLKLHLDIIDGKIWIQHDGTEGGIANKLVDSGTDTRSESVPERSVNRGVPKHDIVLGFHPPFKRQFTEFAVG